MLKIDFEVFIYDVAVILGDVFKHTKKTWMSNRISLVWGRSPPHPLKPPSSGHNSVTKTIRAVTKTIILVSH